MSETGRARSVLLLTAGALVLTTAVGATIASRPGDGRTTVLQRELDHLVGGRESVAPGAAAYVSGPRGTWAGSAGLANVKTHELMRPDARLHLDSVSKAWGAVLILQLVGESRLRLDDRVERVLPGLLPDGDRITVLELLNHTSGLIDTDDLAPDPLRFLRRVRDARLRSTLTSLVRRQATHPTALMSPRVWVALAAAVPLWATPGTTFHYSNIGYMIIAMLAEEVGRAPIAMLLQRRISRPLGLNSVGYQPQGELAGPHPRDYNRGVDGIVQDATGWNRQGQAIDGGIVASTRDEGRFLAALMRGRLLRPVQLTALKATTAASDGYALGFSVVGTPCGEIAYQHNGSSFATASSVFVSEDGRRVAVVAVNGNVSLSARRLDPRVVSTVEAAAERIFCAA